MARDVPAAVLTALQAEHRWVQVLLEIDTTPAKYYALGAFDFLHGGNTYSAREFAIDVMRYGAPGAAGTTVVVDNRDSELSDLAYTTGMAPNTLTITWLVKDDPGDDWSTAYEIAAAEIAEASGGGSPNITLQLRGDRRLNARPMGGGPMTQSCRHRVFKGPRCKYAGADTTCDRSWNDCTSKSNTANFGGIRRAPRAGETIEIATGSPVTVARAPAVDDDPYSGIPYAYRSLIDLAGGRVGSGGRRIGGRRVGGRGGSGG